MKVMVIMPGYNVAATLERAVASLPAAFREHPENILLGNNLSSDETGAIGARLGLQVLNHTQNYGYGGNLKRLYREALRQGADVMVEVHPDCQYEPALADMLVEYVTRGYFEVVQGNRIRSREESLSGGMPLYRYLGNRILTLFENLWFGVNLGEWHSGMRAYHRVVLEALPLESYPDTHAFASDIMMDCVMHGFRVAEVPVPVCYEEDSSSVNVTGLFAYTFRTVVAAFKRPPWRKKRYGTGPRAAACAAV